MTTRIDHTLFRLTRRQTLQWLGLGAGATLAGCAPTTGEDAADTDTAATEPVDDTVVQPAPGLPEPRYIDTNGIRMAVYDTGGDGIPVVFNHGFPELAYSWRHQLEALADAGYRAIEPDQRGYGLTDSPEGMENYTLGHLCGDMDGMLDALGIDQAVFCGHDWGGGVVWMMVRLFPEKVKGVIGVNTPAFHPAHQRDPNPLIVRTENYYTTTFQPEGQAEAVLSKDVRASFEFFMRRGGMWNAEEFKALPEDSAARQLDLLRMIEEGNPTGEVFLTEDELAYFVDTFEKTGFTGGLNWYRASAQVQSPPPEGVVWDISVPCLYVGADNDVVLPPSSADGMEDYISDLEKETITDCGHWTQQEKPDELNTILLDWLGRKIA